MGVAADASDLDSMCGKVEDKEDVIADETKWSHDLGREKVAPTDRAPMCLQERRSASRSIGSGLEASFGKDLGDGRAGDGMSELLHGTANTGVSPGRVLVGNFDHERANLEAVVGRPAIRCSLPSCLRATSFRYQPRIVSGPAGGAIFSSPARPTV